MAPRILRHEELRNLQKVKVVPNKRTRKWVVLAKFSNNKTTIVAGGLNSRDDATTFMQALVNRARSARTLG